MSRSDVEMDFPLLIGLDFELSDADFTYNCLAYALGDTSQWWEPPYPPGGKQPPGHYWPPGFDEDIRVATVEEIIKLHGFTREVKIDDPLETDAIAIFANGSEWTHFAKYHQGKWLSKLGEGHDVSDVAPTYLEGSFYGKVTKILAR